MISIHTLHAEGDLNCHMPHIKLNHFYPHPPCGGWQKAEEKYFAPIIISIHTLHAEGDIWARWWRTINRYFYPHPPCGGWPYLTRPRDTADLFLSTPSMRRVTANMTKKSPWFSENNNNSQHRGILLVGQEKFLCKLHWNLLAGIPKCVCMRCEGLCQNLRTYPSHCRKICVWWFYTSNMSSCDHCGAQPMCSTFPL